MSHQSCLAPHEGPSIGTRDLHLALSSLFEELEAVDGYEHRANVTPEDDSGVLAQRDAGEDVEHPMMTLDWLLGAAHGAASSSDEG